MKKNIKSPFWKAFESRNELKQFGNNALSLFALQIGLSIEEDIISVAANCIVDGNDDKKNDLVYIDTEKKIALIVQSYVSQNPLKREAKANKASDLNAAVSWLLAGEFKKMPERLQPHAEELRRVISNNDVDRLCIWYIHNLPVSKNVGKELEQVEKTAKALIKSEFKIKNSISVEALEIGMDVLEEWYKSLSNPIMVTDTLNIEIYDGYEMKQSDWKAFVTSIQGGWLYEQFKKHGKKFFSANVRDYLGSRKSDKNINDGIKKTAKSSPQNFWVFNNGITILTNSYKKTTKNKKTILTINGASVINGAQTTGTLGHLGSTPKSSLRVQARFIVCENPKTIQEIVNFNNSQNKINPSDFRSGDLIQTRLEEEFRKIPDVDYSPRRGGNEDMIKRRPNLLSSLAAGQIIAGFHGKPGIAYHKKTFIWEDDTLYSNFFNNNVTADHINFAYSLVKAIQNKKFDLNRKSKESTLTAQEQKQLEYYRKRGSIIMMETAISNCMEIILNEVIPNKFRLTFKKNISPNDGAEIFKQIVDVASSFSSHLLGGLSDGFKNDNTVDEAVRTFVDLIDSTKEANKKIFSNFSKQVDIR